VPTERRKHPRVARPFEGSWSGISGTTKCRITNISLGGCFVQSLTLPVEGDTTTVTIAFGDHGLSFAGHVVYVDPGRGFGVQFTEAPDAEAAEFVRLLKLLGSGQPTA
jgi:hypothetical protein